jgi:hypothetical protein
MTIKTQEEGSQKTDNVSAFVPKKGTKGVKEPTSEELKQKGLETFLEIVNNKSVGFFAIVFDENNDPKIIWAGDIELINALGSLEMAKNELYSNVFLGDII